MARALIIVDVQNDFCDLPESALPVQGGAEVAGQISAHVAAHRADYDAVVATRDWHVDPGSHFSDDPDYRESWPSHCVAGTAGAAFHPDLDLARVDAVFSKGRFQASYSGFEGATADGDGTGLGDWLLDRGIDTVDVVGLATDHCVRATALDAAAKGLDTTVLVDLCRGVDAQTTDAALEELAAAGIHLT